MDDLHLVPVATGLSDFEAKLLAAQLGADGILWQTRGIVDSIYPFGGIDVLVPRDQLDDARQVLVAIGDRVTVDAAPVGAGHPAERPGPDGAGPATGPTRWLALAAVGAVLAVVVVRAFALV